MQDNNNDVGVPDEGQSEFPKIAPVVDVHGRPDHDLQRLVSASVSLGVPVMLYMPWGIATGYTAGYKAFYTHLAEKFRGNRTVPLDDSGSAETWAEIIDEYAAKNFDKMAGDASRGICGRVVQGWIRPRVVHRAEGRTLLSGHSCR